MSTSVAPAVITANWGPGEGEVERTARYEVLYNPKEFSLEKNLQYGEINIPGLDAPLQQYIRGQAEKLTVELFFDTTDKKGMGEGAVSVTEHTDKIYRLAKIESGSHAPPIVTFEWSDRFPGCDINNFSNPGDVSVGGDPGSDSADSGTATHPSFNLVRTSFVGVVESVRQQFTLFSSEGVPLRATVNLVLREFRPLHEQLAQMRQNSPDRTHSHPLKHAETLSAIAGKYYGNSGRWRHIARENEIADPRRLDAGRIISVPSIK